MGVFGALNSAVSGLTAQSYALENISGNIANSSTFGYKRLDTSFSDFVSGGGGPQSGQIAGGVSARSRATNTIAGDYLPFNGQDTFISIDGPGYFVVTERTGDSNGQPVFSSVNYYTRAGDFEKDSAGRLVNGAGYYLLGRPIDPVTRNVAGGAPQIIRIDNSLIPAVRTNRVTLQRGALPTSFGDGRGGPLNTALTTTAGAGGPFALGTRLGFNQITNANITNFINSSIGGGAVTGYNAVGEPVNVQLQWAKTDPGDPTAKVNGGTPPVPLTAFPGGDTFKDSVITLTRGNTVSTFTLDDTLDQKDRFNSELSAAGYKLDLIDGKVKISRADGAAFEIAIDNNNLSDALGLATVAAIPATVAAVPPTQQPSVLTGSTTGLTAFPDTAALDTFVLTLNHTDSGGNSVNTTYTFSNQLDQLAAINTAIAGAGYAASLDGSGAPVISRADGRAFTVSVSNNAIDAALGFGATVGSDRSVAAGALTPNPSNFTGSVNTLNGLTDLGSLGGETITLRVGNTTQSFALQGTSKVNDLIAGLTGNGFTASLTANPGALSITNANGDAFDIYVSDDAVATALGIAPATGPVPVSSLPPTKDTWALYYNSNTDPQVQTDVVWQKIGDYQFDKNTGELVYPVPSVITIQDLAVDGESLGEVQFDIPEGVLKQINAPGGFQLEQNGFPAGEVVSTAINDSGRLVATYSNGRQRDLYEIPIATFSGEGELSRRDGSVFSETSESGQPIFAGGGSINGGSVEGSNVDIADEFSKLIVTQQAYSANTRIITTADELLQESINIIR